MIGLLAAGGAAFTASNNITGTNEAGYGTLAVTGADISGLQYTLGGDGTTITGLTMSFSPSIDAASTVAVGWGDGVTPPALSSTGCTVTGGGSGASCTGLTQDTASAKQLAIAVSR